MNEMENTINLIIRDVCELPDYNSPDDNPELLMCTVGELEYILKNRLLGIE